MSNSRLEPAAQAGSGPSAKRGPIRRITAALLTGLMLCVLLVATGGTALATPDSPGSIANKLDPGRDGSVFWSGTINGESVMDKAGRWARSAGRSTLETRIEDEGIRDAGSDRSDPRAVAWWNTVSRIFASKASGNAFFYAGAVMRPNNVWESIEFPTLKANHKITCVYRVEGEGQSPSIDLKHTLIWAPKPENCPGKPRGIDPPEWFVRVSQACDVWVEGGLPRFVTPHSNTTRSTPLAAPPGYAGNLVLYGGQPEDPGPPNTNVYSLEPTTYNRNSAGWADFIDHHIRMHVHFADPTPSSATYADVYDGEHRLIGQLAISDHCAPLPGGRFVPRSDDNIRESLVRNWATGRCLDSNYQNAVYTLGCNFGNYQKWLIVNTGDGTVTLINSETGFCLDSNDEGRVYAIPCNGGSYQRWNRTGLLSRGPNVIQYVNVQTGRCLDSNAEGSVYTLGCNGGGYQDWREGY